MNQDDRFALLFVGTLLGLSILVLIIVAALTF